MVHDCTYRSIDDIKWLIEYQGDNYYCLFSCQYVCIKTKHNRDLLFVFRLISSYNLCFSGFSYVNKWNFYLSLSIQIDILFVFWFTMVFTSNHCAEKQLSAWIFLRYICKHLDSNWFKHGHSINDFICHQKIKTIQSTKWTCKHE